MKNNSCSFCNILPTSVWYYLTDKYKIVDCSVCHTEILIWSSHSDPSIAEVFQLEDAIAKMQHKTFDRTYKPKHPTDHWHVHLV